MTAGLFDEIVHAYVTALQNGHAALVGTGLVLGAFFTFVAFAQLGAAALPRAALPEALPAFVYVVAKCAFFKTLIVGMPVLAGMLFGWFLSWGNVVSRGVFGAEMFQQPSRVLEMGASAAFPLIALISAFKGVAALWNFPIILTYLVAYWIILGLFALMALHLMTLIVLFHMSVMVSPVLLPWGLISETAFFAEFSLSWIMGNLIRILLTSLNMAIAVPFFERLAPVYTVGGDATYWSAILMVIGAAFFGIMAWQAGKGAALVGGRGMSLPIGGELLLRPVLVAGRSVLRGTSQFLHR